MRGAQELRVKESDRIAVAFAMAGLVSSDPVIVRDCTKATTSYPSFVRDAQLLGLQIQMN